MNHLAKNEETGQTRCQKKRVRRKKEAGKEGDKKSKVPPYTTPPPDRPPPAENMLIYFKTLSLCCGVRCKAFGCSVGWADENGAEFAGVLELEFGNDFAGG